MISRRRGHVLQERLRQAINDAKDWSTRIQARREEESIAGRIEPDHVLATDLGEGLGGPVASIGVRIQENRLAGDAATDHQFPVRSQGEARGRARGEGPQTGAPEVVDVRYV